MDDEEHILMSVITSWNNPNNLTSGGWSRCWCRLCGIMGSSCNTWDKSGIRVIKNKTRSAYLCDKCRDKESIINEEVTL